MLGHKTSLGKFKKAEIIVSFLATMLEESTTKRKTAKSTHMWTLNNMLLNNQSITEEIKEEIKKVPEDK